MARCLRAQSPTPSRRYGASRRLDANFSPRDGAFDVFKTLGIEFPERIKVTNAAREKGVARAAVYYALASGKITGERIAGTVMVVDNDKFRQWTPGRR
ncbi:MAG: hypothetical protein BWY57_03467 [Betaproteobacteria bacterium ADurb.Bin341]|nr:MAG: hypothetical protein BWY57_03467 [Betaproteobacteria bacterium ADurb.Bin341]